MLEVQLTYGLNSQGHLCHVCDVPNGLACDCTCPGCGATLVAKNHGVNVHPHFAHASGLACHGGHESELHLLAKEILMEEKAVMLPPYGKVYSGGFQSFMEMEMEKRFDTPSLQPDVVGIQIRPRTKQITRLWIEIRVTHEVGPDKYERIKQLGIPCIEINLSSFLEHESSKDQIRQFLLNSRDNRIWINNPTLERRLQEYVAQRRAYAEKMKGISATSADTNHLSSLPNGLKSVARVFCETCPFHSTRQAIIKEMILQKFPANYRNIIMHLPLSWLKERIIHPMPVNPQDYILTIGNNTLYFPTSSPDVYGKTVSPSKLKQNHRAISFFLHHLPHLANSLGNRCDHTQGYQTSQDSSGQASSLLLVICNHANINK